MRLCINYMYIGGQLELKSIAQSVKLVDRKCDTIAAQQGRILSELVELKELILGMQKKNFTLKGSTYEVFIHSGHHSLAPPTDSINVGKTEGRSCEVILPDDFPIPRW